MVLTVGDKVNIQEAKDVASDDSLVFSAGSYDDLTTELESRLINTKCAISESEFCLRVLCGFAQSK